MPGKKPRMIVGWRQMAVTKVRVRPVREVPAPRGVASEPVAPSRDPAVEKP